MYNKKTQQGWDIISKLELVGATHIVFKRKDNDFGWASYYNEETGTWGHGHYDYEDPNLALEDLIEFALDKTLIPYGEKSFKGELQAYAIKQAEDDFNYERNPIDTEEEFLDEFYQEKYGEFQKAFELYKQERSKLEENDYE